MNILNFFLLFLVSFKCVLLYSAQRVQAQYEGARQRSVETTCVCEALTKKNDLDQQCADGDHSIDSQGVALSEERKSDLDLLKKQLFLDLAVDRRSIGVPESHMTTHELTHVVTGDRIYQFISGKGIDLASPEEAMKCGIRDFKTHASEPPRELDYLDVEGHWDAEAHGTADESNILGGYGQLTLKSVGNALKVPLVEATEETLRYYKAHLLRSGDYFRFETHTYFPIFQMSVGKNYVPSFIMNGKGLYLEYHDEPHYHEPMDAEAGGVYLLARVLRDLKSGIEWVRITGFKVPYGFAVYSEPGAIHDDATTQGNWRVGYVNAQQFSTVLIRNIRGEKVGIEFRPSEKGAGF